MNPDMVCSGARVLICCAVFAFFVVLPLKEKFRYNMLRTSLLFSALVVITVVVTVLFLVHGSLFACYSSLGIIIWIASAVGIFRMAIKGSYAEVLFIVLVILNLYVNIAAIAKIIVYSAEHGLPDLLTYNVVMVAVLIIYIPPLYILMNRLLKRVVELNISSSFWNYIWMIPVLTYMIFFFKFIKDYWKNPVNAGKDDIIFGVLWSFTTYALFWVTLQMLYQACKGISNREQMERVSSQLRMQKEQYKWLIEDMENTARVRHDWRHHLLTITSFAESEEVDKLKAYLKVLMPEVESKRELQLCDNHVIDIILQHYMTIAGKNQIALKVYADIPENTSIQEMDLCIIFGNLVENAVEACQAYEAGDKSVEVTARMKGMQLIIMVKNTYKNMIIEKNGVYKSTKHEGSGIGLSSVKKVVEKYYGLINIEYDAQKFQVYVLLNIA